MTRFADTSDRLDAGRPLRRLNPEQLEQLVEKLLAAEGFSVNPVADPAGADLGRDFEATRIGRYQRLETWYVECQFRRRGSLRLGDVADGILWSQNDPIDDYLVATNVPLSSRLQEWLKLSSERLRAPVVVWDREALVGLLHRHEGVVSEFGLVSAEAIG